MAFYETQFPPAISFGATGGPAYLTNVVAVNSGAEFRDQVWSAGRASYDVAHAARNMTQYRAVLAFFRAMRGRLHGFRFKDWSDYQAASGEGVFVLLTSTTFQMYKRYTSGSQTEDRKITKPVTGTAVITGGSGATVNTTTGVVTVSSGTPTAWTGEFDVPCRFDIDHLAAEVKDKSGGSFIMGIASIPIIELRV